MEQGSPQTQAPRNNLKWDSLKDDYLVECMVEQHSMGTSIPNGFTGNGWKAITTKMIAKYGPEYSREKLKNRFKTIKKTYGLLKLMFSLSGFGWDPYGQMVTAEKEVWDDFLAVHTDAGHIRGKKMPNYFSLALIFGDNIADGRIGFAARDPIATPETGSTQNGQTDEYFNINIEQPELHEEYVASATTTPNNVAGPSGTSKQVSLKGKNAVARDMVNAVHVVAASISEVAREQVTPRPDMSTCIAAVEELNLDPLTECRVIAHLEQDMKSQTFMALKPEKRLFWLHVELDI